jgi:hypothetical protein
MLEKWVAVKVACTTLQVPFPQPSIEFNRGFKNVHYREQKLVVVVLWLVGTKDPHQLVCAAGSFEFPGPLKIRSAGDGRVPVRAVHSTPNTEPRLFVAAGSKCFSEHFECR